MLRILRNPRVAKHTCNTPELTPAIRLYYSRANKYHHAGDRPTTYTGGIAAVLAGLPSPEKEIEEVQCNYHGPNGCCDASQLLDHPLERADSPDFHCVIDSPLQVDHLADRPYQIRD